jgi:hypothetical protein
MSFSSKNARCAALPAVLVALSYSLTPAQRVAAAPADVIVPSITVQASSSAAQTAADQFLAGFITTAVRLEGQKFISCIATAAKLRPDLAAKIVVCALNIARLNSRLPGGQLSFATIDQIVKAAVTAAPQSAAAIVKAAIESEPYARVSIIAAAIAAAPGQEAEINAAANETRPMSMFALAPSINPVENLPSSNVNSPEQPPAGP